MFKTIFSRCRNRTRDPPRIPYTRWNWTEETQLTDLLGQTGIVHDPTNKPETSHRANATRKPDHVENKSQLTLPVAYLNVVTKRFARLDANARSTVDDSLQNDLLREFFKLTPALKVDERKAKTSSRLPSIFSSS